MDPEAIGGVIQIFSRKVGSKDTPSITLDAGGGSYNTYRVAGTVNGKWKNNWYTLGSSGLVLMALMPGSQRPGSSALISRTTMVIITRQ